MPSIIYRLLSPDRNILSSGKYSPQKSPVSCQDISQQATYYRF